MTTLATKTAPAELQAFLDDVRTSIDENLARRLAPPPEDPGSLCEAMHYAATGPGKRLRPAVLIAAAEACGGTRARAMPAAIAIEMLHAYTLVHDDLPAMDDDDERRGRPTVHVTFGEAIAILAGDGLLTAAFGALAELGPDAGAAVSALARRAGARELLGGQAIDLTENMSSLASSTNVERASLLEGVSRSIDATPTLARVERLHAAKTGALFAAAAELGAIAAGATQNTVALLGRYGMALGIAFQHADDRDDREFAHLADEAAARMRELGAEARSIAHGFGPRGARLEAIAAWFAEQA
ncbi:MAG: polyprenyl synthetase family protein [Kofleriaceae bacterium]